MTTQQNSNGEIAVAQTLNTANGQIHNGQFDVQPNQTVLNENGETKIEETLPKKVEEPQKIKRPMNPFMIFGCEKRRKLAQVHPRMHNSEISKILGAEWKRMSDYEKAPYIQEAKRLKEQHSIEYPNYKFKANRRKPRQAIKKERPSFPYAPDLNSLPTAMKFPYPSPFFQDTMYGSMYPAMAGGSHPAYSTMYDYSSAIARQAMTVGNTVRGAQAVTTTASSTTDYYPLNKSVSGNTLNDYYGAAVNKSDYYTMHTTSGSGNRSERTTPGVDGTNLTERYSSPDNRAFENRYSSTFNGSQSSSLGAYTTMQNISHLANEAPSAYTYTSLYEQRH